MEKEDKQPLQPAQKSDKEKEKNGPHEELAGAKRPEQTPDVPPQERTMGIP